eukprot:m.31422 g.31422  ORF g.31422 m.31422 type:complete len:172 (+) comp8315_c0_seq4:292-807(+)
MSKNRLNRSANYKKNYNPHKCHENRCTDVALPQALKEEFLRQWDNHLPFKIPCPEDMLRAINQIDTEKILTFISRTVYLANYCGCHHATYEEFYSKNCLHAGKSREGISIVQNAASIGGKWNRSVEDFIMERAMERFNAPKLNTVEKPAEEKRGVKRRRTSRVRRKTSFWG